jgi:hypothetical protein
MLPADVKRIAQVVAVVGADIEQDRQRRPGCSPAQAV